MHPVMLLHLRKWCLSFSFQSHPPPRILNLQSYSYTYANASQFRSKNDLLEKYSQKLFQALEENQRLLKEVRSISSDKMSLLIVKDPTRNVLNFALTGEEKVAKVKIQMDKVNCLIKSYSIIKPMKFSIMICYICLLIRIRWRIKLTDWKSG